MPPATGVRCVSRFFYSVDLFPPLALTGDGTLTWAKSYRKLQSQNELTCCTTALQTLTSPKLPAHSAHSTRTLPEKLYTKRIVSIGG